MVAIGCRRQLRPWPSRIEPRSPAGRCRGLDVRRARCAGLSTTWTTWRVAETAERQPEVERRADHHDHVGVGLQDTTACARTPARDRRAGSPGRGRSRTWAPARSRPALRNASHAPSQYTSVPAMIAGRSALASKRGRPLAPRPDRARHRRRRRRAGHVAFAARRTPRRAGSRGTPGRDAAGAATRAGVGRPARCRRPQSTVTGSLVIGASTGTWSNSCSDPTPTGLRRTAAEHDEWRAVELRGRDRSDAVGHAGAGRQHRDAGPAGQLGRPLGREAWPSARGGRRRCASTPVVPFTAAS